ncbi:hypothetical protein BR93DRAFT_143443 [Coniochaeta sp. PMI_546]|nr:hypothetical protein BR93DRAFT_143443 [Coniochaeta sp. PMI_546]
MVVSYKTCCLLHPTSLVPDLMQTGRPISDVKSDASTALTANFREEHTTTSFGNGNRHGLCKERMTVRTPHIWMSRPGGKTILLSKEGTRTLHLGEASIELCMYNRTVSVNLELAWVSNVHRHRKTHQSVRLRLSIPQHHNSCQPTRALRTYAAWTYDLGAAV